MHAGEVEPEGVVVQSVVAGEGEEAFVAKNREGNSAEDRLGRPTGQYGVCDAL